jgi:hypothetical protein
LYRSFCHDICNFLMSSLINCQYPQWISIQNMRYSYEWLDKWRIDELTNWLIQFHNNSFVFHFKSLDLLTHSMELQSPSPTLSNWISLKKDEFWFIRDNHKCDSNLIQMWFKSDRLKQFSFIPINSVCEDIPKLIDDSILHFDHNSDLCTFHSSSSSFLRFPFHSLEHDVFEMNIWQSKEIRTWKWNHKVAFAIKQWHFM